MFGLDFLKEKAAGLVNGVVEDKVKSFAPQLAEAFGGKDGKGGKTILAFFEMGFDMLGKLVGKDWKFDLNNDGHIGLSETEMKTAISGFEKATAPQQSHHVPAPPSTPKVKAPVQAPTP